MDRRNFLQLGSAAVAAGALGGRAAAATATQAAPQAAIAPGADTARTKLKVDAYSRHLQWLRTADEVADATTEMGFTGVDITVRPYPGHVDPAKVKTDLPPFVKTLQKHGLGVSMITSPITDADSPNAEEILGTASSLGIKHYWWGTFRYDGKQPIQQQLDALKPRVEKLVALNRKYGMKAMYHTYSMPGTVGENVWDFLTVLRNFDPQYVSFHWDVGHTTVTGGNGTWAQSLLASAPYLGGLSVKEYTWELALETPQGGPFTGKPEDLQQRFGRGGPGGPGAGGGRGPGGSPGGPGSQPKGTPGTPGTAAAPAAPTGGAGLPAQRAPSPATAQAAQQEAAERGAQAPIPPTGQGAGGGQTASGMPGGRGPGGPRAPLGRGGGGQPNPWRTRPVPLGEGINNLPLLASLLVETNFNGPVEIQSEYPNGGAENAGDKLTLPRAIVLGNMKRDRLTLNQAFQASGLL